MSTNYLNCFKTNSINIVKSVWIKSKIKQFNLFFDKYQIILALYVIEE